MVSHLLRVWSLSIFLSLSLSLSLSLCHSLSLSLSLSLSSFEETKAFHCTCLVSEDEMAKRDILTLSATLAVHSASSHRLVLESFDHFKQGRLILYYKLRSRSLSGIYATVLLHKTLYEHKAVKLLVTVFELPVEVC
eukprot:sb/3474503/